MALHPPFPQVLLARQLLHLQTTLVLPHPPRETIWIGRSKIGPTCYLEVKGSYLLKHIRDKLKNSSKLGTL